MTDDEAVLKMLAGASFGPGSKVVLPSGRAIGGDEAQALSSLYAPAAGSQEGRVMSDDLVTWLRAQLDDDARPAQATLDEGPMHEPSSRDDEGRLVIGDRAINVWATTHIGRWSPARVLAEVAAKRAIIDGWRDPATVRRLPAGIYDGRDQDEVEAQLSIAYAVDRVVRLLALPYADRAGFREEWRP